MKIVKDIGRIAFPAHLLAILPHFEVKRGEIDITRFGKNYAYALTAVVAISSCIICIEVLSESHSFKIISMSGDTEEINQTIETLFCIISYSIVVITGSQNAEKHYLTLNEIAKIDEFLESTGYAGAYSCPVLVGSLYSMSASVIGVAYYYIRRSQMDQKYQFVLLTVYIMQLCVSSTFAVYFRVILMNVTRRIEFVNDKLKQFTRDGSRNNEENWRELSNLIEVFCKFRYITENLNAVTGVGLLFYMGYAFYTVTNQSYLAFSTLTNHVAFSEKFQLMGLSASWVIAEIVIMSVLCSSCEAISSECPIHSTLELVFEKVSCVWGKPRTFIHNISDIPIMGEWPALIAIYMVLDSKFVTTVEFGYNVQSCEFDEFPSLQADVAVSEWKRRYSLLNGNQTLAFNFVVITEMSLQPRSL